MTPKQQFDINIRAADYYVRMYKELRQLKGLGARGQLDSANRYLLWLPRAAVVSALSSLDAYVHQTLYERIPQLLGGPHSDVPDELAKMVSSVTPFKSADDVRKLVKLMNSSDPASSLATSIEKGKLQFASFQAPHKIEGAYKLVGVDDPFGAVAAAWPGPATSKDEIRNKLDRYYKRRNQIAHEGDLNLQYNPRPMQPKYASDCRTFIAGLVERLDTL